MTTSLIKALPLFTWQDLETVPRGLHRGKIIRDPFYDETPIYYSTGRGLPRNVGSLIDYGAGQFAWARNSWFIEYPQTVQRATYELLGQLVMSPDIKELTAI